MTTWDIKQGNVLDILKTMPDNQVHCVVTSPPYWGLRDYKIEPQIWGGDPGCRHEWSEHIQPAANGIIHQNVMSGETLSGSSATRKIKVSAFCHCGGWRGSLGLEPTPELYIEHMVIIFNEVKRVLRSDGTLWLNMGDSYANDAKWGGTTGGKHASGLHGENVGRGKRHTNLKPKDLVGMPWRVAFALQAAGWWLRSDIIWSKPNPMPESVTDRPTRSHEYIFLLSKSRRYYYDLEATKEPCLSGDSDITKMLENKDRLGGKTLTADDPLYAANQDTNIGQKRGVGGTVRFPSGWVHRGQPDSHHDLTGRYKAHGHNSRMSQDRDPDHPPDWEENPPHISLFRNSRTVWGIATQPYRDAHFATFPEEIPARAIKAGTSEKGCCPKCGKAWRRKIKSSVVGTKRNENGRYAKHNGDDGTNHYLSKTDIHGSKIVTTLGFAAACGCDAGEPVPAVVFDPFCGSGTTGLVALHLERSFIGIELNPEYVRMAERRIVDVEPLFRMKR